MQKRMSGAFTRRQVVAVGLGLGALAVPIAGRAQDFSAVDKAWGEILARYTHQPTQGPRLVNYAALKGHRGLASYVRRLEGMKVSRLPRASRFAFWVNLYNARTVQVVAEHYPVKSIRDIKLSGLFKAGPWGAKLLRVEGKELSLDDVEHRILRPQWQDARIHYAVNCASVGCPDLAAQPWRPQGLSAQLDRAATAYVNSERGLRKEGKKLVLSSIYKWYNEDFNGGGKEGVFRHLTAYAGRGKRWLGREGSRPRVSYAYDWSLNDWQPEKKNK